MYTVTKDCIHCGNPLMLASEIEYECPRCGYTEPTEDARWNLESEEWEFDRFWEIPQPPKEENDHGNMQIY
jgi:ribosomal protein S27AE